MAITVPKLYQSVVDDVIQNVKEAFQDDGIDDGVLQELKQLWESKLGQSKAVTASRQASEQEQMLRLNESAPSSQHVRPNTGGAMALASQSKAAPPVRVIQQLNQPRTQMPVVVAAGTPNQGTANMAIIQQYQAQLAQLAMQGVTGQVLLRTPHGNMLATIPSINKPDSGTGAKQPTPQLDGANDSSSEEEEEDVDKDDEQEDVDDGQEEGQKEEDPLNTDDDVSEEDPADVFDTENVVVCQFDKISRSKNKWKFHLKDGIMNLNGRDYVFQKANGDAEW